MLSSDSRVLCLFATLTVALAACDSGPTPEAADLVLRGGKIVTVDEQVPEAQALAARDGRIVAVGSNAEIADYIGEGTEVLELDGNLAIPGFIEGHGHYMGVGRSTLRLWVMIRARNESLAENLAAYRVVGHGDRLTVRAIKKSIDGALGSHGAWLLEPYDDLPTSTGLNTTSPEDIRETARLAMENGYQLNVHAIGDRANRETLDIFEEAYSAQGDGDYRWRVEHAQHLHPDDIPRFGALGVIASMQGVHATSDGPWVELKLGAQRAREGAYVWQKLMASGAVIMNGTDAPVEDVDPLASYYATVSRTMNNGGVFFADQRMSRIEGLQSYTINAAFGAFEEDIKGSLTVGRFADVTVLSLDIMTVAEEEIPDTEVVYTIVGGEVVYRRGGQ